MGSRRYNPYDPQNNAYGGAQGNGQTGAQTPSAQSNTSIQQPKPNYGGNLGDTAQMWAQTLRGHIAPPSGGPSVPGAWGPPAPSVPPAYGPPTGGPSHPGAWGPPSPSAPPALGPGGPPSLRQTTTATPTATPIPQGNGLFAMPERGGSPFGQTSNFVNSDNPTTPGEGGGGSTDGGGVGGGGSPDGGLPPWEGYEDVNEWANMANIYASSDPARFGQYKGVTGNDVYNYRVSGFQGHSDDYFRLGLHKNPYYKGGGSAKPANTEDPAVFAAWARTFTGFEGTTPEDVVKYRTSGFQGDFSAWYMTARPSGADQPLPPTGGGGVDNPNPGYQPPPYGPGGPIAGQPNPWDNPDGSSKQSPPPLPATPPGVGVLSDDGPWEGTPPPADPGDVGIIDDRNPPFTQYADSPFKKTGPNESDTLQEYLKLFDPLFDRASSEFARRARAEAALAGGSDAVSSGGFGTSLVRGLGDLEAQHSAQLGGMVHEAYQNAANRGVQMYQIDTDKFIAEIQNDTARFGIKTNAELERYLNDRKMELERYGIDTNKILEEYKAQLALQGVKYSSDAGVTAAGLHAAAANAAAGANAAAARYAAELDYDLGIVRTNADIYRADQDDRYRWEYLRWLMSPEARMGGNSPVQPPGVFPY